MMMARILDHCGAQTMFKYYPTITCLALAGLLCAQLTLAIFDEDLLASPAEIVRSRGFIAIEHYYTTSEGYILHLCQCRNPRIKNYNTTSKEPLLFIHGTLTNSKCFLLSSKGARPADYSHLDIDSMSIEELEEFFKYDLSADSLVFLALNTGYEVWFMDRRGCSYSQGHTSKLDQTWSESLFGGYTYDFSSEIIQAVGAMDSPTTIISTMLSQFARPILGFNQLFGLNPKYWGYSMDEQARHDIPEVVFFVLKISGHKKLTIIGHSVGGALPIMALSLNETLCNKVSKVIAWAPALDLGGSQVDKSMLRQMFYIIQPTLSRYNGPIRPSVAVPLLQNLMTIVCNSVVMQNMVCETLYDIILGPSGHQQALGPEFLQAALDTVSAHELAHLIQSMQKTRTYHYDYSAPDTNLDHYGTDRPPIYDFTDIKFNQFSIWWGKTDTLVSPDAIELLLTDINSKKPTATDLHYLNGTQLFFDHASFLIHKNIAKLLNIPTLKTIAKRFLS